MIEVVLEAALGIEPMNKGFADRLGLRFPEDKATIVFLGNLDVAPMEAIARSLTAITFGEKYHLPKQAIAQVLFETISNLLSKSTIS